MARNLPVDEFLCMHFGVGSDNLFTGIDRAHSAHQTFSLSVNVVYIRMMMIYIDLSVCLCFPHNTSGAESKTHME